MNDHSGDAPAVADRLRAAADLVELRAGQATPPPWWRPLDVRNKACILAPLPDGEQGTWIDGIHPETGRRESCTVLIVNIWSDGTHSRKRNGRDLEWAAMMNPAVAGPLARMLRAEAVRIGRYQPHTQVSVVDPDLLELAEAVLKSLNRPPSRRC